MSLFQKKFGRESFLLSTLTPTTYFFITFSIALLSHFTFPFYLSSYIPANLLQVIGITLLLIALTLNTLAFKAFKTYLTPHAPFAQAQALITTSIFRFSRNPVYLALVIVQVGFGFIIDSVWFFVMASMLFALLNRFIIPNEEKMLQKSFGEEYGQYKRRVGRWVRLHI